MIDHAVLSALRARFTKYQTKKVGRVANRFYQAPDKNTWTQKKIWDFAKFHYAKLLPFLEGRYDEAGFTRPMVEQFSRLLDRIESGMIELIDGEIVVHDKPTKRPDAVHRIQILNSGRPVLRLSTTAPEPAKSLRNPFRKG